MSITIIAYILIGLLLVIVFGLFVFKIISFIKGVGTDPDKKTQDDSQNK